MPRTIRQVEQRVDSDRKLRYIREILHNRDAYEEDLKAGYDEAWKEKFEQDWNKATSTVKEAVQ